MNTENSTQNTQKKRPNLGRRSAVGLLLIAALLAVSAFSKPARAAQTADTDIIYLESNDARTNQNAILAYRRTPDGAVSALPGSPFFMGGSGSSATRDTDQNVIVSPDQTLLFAVNCGSNSIAVFHIAPDGTLTPVSDSPFPSGGVTPVSVGLLGDRLYVAHLGGNFPQPMSNYTGFTVAPDGGLTPILGATVTVGYGAHPTQTLTTPQAPLVFGADFGSGKIQAFRITASGAMQQSPNTPLSSDAPLGLTAHPTQPILYVGLPFAAQLGVYTFDSAGTLTPVTRASNSGSAICWLTVTRDGKNLYSTNTGDNSVSWYDLSNPLAPIERQHLPLTGGGGAFQLMTNAAGNYLYVVTQRFSSNLNENALHTFRIGASGVLTEVGSPLVLPLSASALPQGVAVIQPPTRVFGQIALEGASPGAIAGQTLTFQFRPTDHSAPFTRRAALDASGNFALPQVPPLTYDIWIKGQKWLAKTARVDAASGAAGGVTVTLPAGDANNDNFVDASDFGLLVGAYGGDAGSPGSGYDARADFNGDGLVDTTDFGLLVGNYGGQGDQ